METGSAIRQIRRQLGMTQETFANAIAVTTSTICNGCQMLSALKVLVPGADHWPRFVRNRSEQFEGRACLVEVLPSPSVFLAGMAGSVLPIAVAHGEGRAEFTDDAAFEVCAASGLVSLRFVIAARDAPRLQQAVKAAQLPTVLMSFDILAESAGSDPVIDLTPLFVSEVPEGIGLGFKKQFGMHGVDPKRSYIDRVKADCIHTSSEVVSLSEKRKKRVRFSHFDFSLLPATSGLNFPKLQRFPPVKKSVSQPHRFFIRITDTKPTREMATMFVISDTGDAVVGCANGVRAASITTFCPGLIEPELV